jgi:hypothetical protein
MKIALVVVCVVTLIVLALCTVGMGMMSMVMANGFMKNTDEMAISYAVCNGVSLLVLVVYSGWLTYALNKHLNLNVWLGGAVSIGSAMLLFGVFMFIAFFIIVSIFGS